MKGGGAGVVCDDAACQGVNGNQSLIFVLEEKASIDVVPWT